MRFGSVIRIKRKCSLLRACVFGSGVIILLKYIQLQHITPQTKASSKEDIARGQSTSRFICGQNIVHDANLNVDDDTIQKTVHNIQIRSSSSWSDLQHLVKIPSHRVYMYSAVGTRELNSQTDEPDDLRRSGFKYIVITGWQHKDLKQANSSCCMRLKNDTIQHTPSSKNTEWKVGNEDLVAVSYNCLLDKDHDDVKGVSMVFNGSCPLNNTAYITPFFSLEDNNNGFAICSKLVYGQQNINALVEWFEILRYLGVDKILVNIHISSTNQESIPVFKYYQSIGLAWLLPYDIPENGSNPRMLHEERYQVWSDEQVTVLDCQARLSGFKYFAVLDKDEIIVPNTLGRGSLKFYIESELGSRPDVAGLTFMTQMHLTSWKEKDPRSGQFFSNYRKCSKPIYDRVKSVVVLDRIKPFRSDTHNYINLTGRKRVWVNSTIASVHHYRRPRKSYTGVEGSLMPDGKCDRMNALADQVQENVKRIMELLNLNKE